MDTELEIEARCENLMNIVVESRKRFGKACIEYKKKRRLMENKILNVQVETVSNYRFKPKNQIPNIEEHDSEEMDDLFVKIKEKQERVNDLLRKLNNTHEVIRQLESDAIGRKLQTTLTAEAMLAQARVKKE